MRQRWRSRKQIKSVSHCVAPLEGSWSFFANLFCLALELEYGWMPKKQNLERVSDVHKNIGVPLICPSGSENKSTFRKERMLWKFRKIVWKTIANRREYVHESGIQDACSYK